MIKEVIGVGETELDALNDAKRQLGLDETDEVEFELIQRAEKKKFGLFGGAPAKVKVTLKATPEDKAEEFLRNVLDKMNLQSVVIEKKSIEGGVEFDLSGEDVGFVIGRRGETLDSLQYRMMAVIRLFRQTTAVIRRFRQTMVAIPRLNTILSSIKMT